MMGILLERESSRSIGFPGTVCCAAAVEYSQAGDGEGSSQSHITCSSPSLGKTVDFMCESKRFSFTITSQNKVQICEQTRNKSYRFWLGLDELTWISRCFDYLLHTELKFFLRRKLSTGNRNITFTYSCNTSGFFVDISEERFEGTTHLFVPEGTHRYGIKLFAAQIKLFCSKFRVSRRDISMDELCLSHEPPVNNSPAIFLPSCCCAHLSNNRPAEDPSPSKLLFAEQLRKQGHEVKQQSTIKHSYESFHWELDNSSVFELEKCLIFKGEKDSISNLVAIKGGKTSVADATGNVTTGLGRKLPSKPQFLNKPEFVTQTRNREKVTEDKIEMTLISPVVDNQFAPQMTQLVQLASGGVSQTDCNATRNMEEIKPEKDVNVVRAIKTSKTSSVRGFNSDEKRDGKCCNSIRYSPGISCHSSRNDVSHKLSSLLSSQIGSLSALATIYKYNTSAKPLSVSLNENAEHFQSLSRASLVNKDITSFRTEDHGIRNPISLLDFPLLF